jgi:hypothetical protein
MPRITKLATVFEAACPDVADVNDIALATRGLLMVALQAEKLRTELTQG